MKWFLIVSSVIGGAQFQSNLNSLKSFSNLSECLQALSYESAVLSGLTKKYPQISDADGISFSDYICINNIQLEKLKNSR